MTDLALIIVVLMVMSFCFSVGYITGHHRGWMKAHSEAFRRTMAATMTALNGRKYLDNKEYD